MQKAQQEYNDVKDGDDESAKSSKLSALESAKKEYRNALEKQQKAQEELEKAQTDAEEIQDKMDELEGSLEEYTDRKEQKEDEIDQQLKEIAGNIEGLKEDLSKAQDELDKMKQELITMQEGSEAANGGAETGAKGWNQIGDEAKEALEQSKYHDYTAQMLGFVDEEGNIVTEEEANNLELDSSLLERGEVVDSGTAYRNQDDVYDGYAFYKYEDGTYYNREEDRFEDEKGNVLPEDSTGESDSDGEADTDNYSEVSDPYSGNTRVTVNLSDNKGNDIVVMQEFTSDGELELRLSGDGVPDEYKDKKISVDDYYNFVDEHSDIDMPHLYAAKNLSPVEVIRNIQANNSNGTEDTALKHYFNKFEDYNSGVTNDDPSYYSNDFTNFLKTIDLENASDDEVIAVVNELQATYGTTDAMISSIRGGSTANQDQEELVPKLAALLARWSDIQANLE